MSRQPSPGPSQQQPFHPPVAATAPPVRTKSKAYSSGIAAGAEDVKYAAKYKDLKRKVKEIESDNDRIYLKILQARRNIQRAQLERAILYERLNNVPASPPQHNAGLPEVVHDTHDVQPGPPVHVEPQGRHHHHRHGSSNNTNTPSAPSNGKADSGGANERVRHRGESSTQSTVINGMTVVTIDTANGPMRVAVDDRGEPIYHNGTYVTEEMLIRDFDNERHEHRHTHHHHHHRDRDRTHVEGGEPQHLSEPRVSSRSRSQPSHPGAGAHPGSNTAPPQALVPPVSTQGLSRRERESIRDIERAGRTHDRDVREHGGRTRDHDRDVRARLEGDAHPNNRGEGNHEIEDWERERERHRQFGHHSYRDRESRAHRHSHTRGHGHIGHEHHNHDHHAGQNAGQHHHHNHQHHQGVPEQVPGGPAGHSPVPAPMVVHERPSRRHDIHELAGSRAPSVGHSPIPAHAQTSGGPGTPGVAIPQGGQVPQPHTPVQAHMSPPAVHANTHVQHHSRHPSHGHGHSHSHSHSHSYSHSHSQSQSSSANSSRSPTEARQIAFTNNTRIHSHQRVGPGANLNLGRERAAAAGAGGDMEVGQERAAGDGNGNIPPPSGNGDVEMDMEDEGWDGRGSPPSSAVRGGAWDRDRGREQGGHERTPTPPS